MDSNVPKDGLVRWKTYGFERYSLRSYKIAPVRTILYHFAQLTRAVTRFDPRQTGNIEKQLLPLLELAVAHDR